MMLTLASASSASTAKAQVIVFYGLTDGHLSVISLRRAMTTFEAKAFDDMFIADKIAPKALSHPFDVINPRKLFKLQPLGFYGVNFGNVLPPHRAVGREIEFNGSLLQHAAAKKNHLNSDGAALVILPAGPSSMLHFLLGLLTFP
jgi:hypothetical protein